jgi:uncharacterized delta-60 repeat protein
MIAEFSSSLTCAFSTTDDSTHGGATALAINSSGKVLVTADILNDESTLEAVLWRYASSGSLDSSFGDDDEVLTPLAYAEQMTIQSDGKLLLAGITDGGNAVLYLNSDGSLDTSYGDDGLSVTFDGGEGISVLRPGRSQSSATLLGSNCEGMALEPGIESGFFRTFGETARPKFAPSTHTFYFDFILTEWSPRWRSNHSCPRQDA